MRSVSAHLAVVMLLSCAGCAPSPQQQPTEKQQPSLAVMAQAHSTMMAAAVEGILTEDDAGCLWVGKDFAVWPVGTSRAGEGVESGGHTIALGDLVTGMGGYLPVEQVAEVLAVDSRAEVTRCVPARHQVVVIEQLEGQT